MSERGRRKVREGVVVSDKMDKTVVVMVERKFRHPVYHKVIIRHKKYKAHNDKLTLVENDTVRIEETKPISKDKHFKVIEKLKI